MAQKLSAALPLLEHLTCGCHKTKHFKRQHVVLSQLLEICGYLDQEAPYQGQGVEMRANRFLAKRKKTPVYIFHQPDYTIWIQIRGVHPKLVQQDKVEARIGKVIDERRANMTWF